MKIRTAEFVKSGVQPKDYPPAELPEVAFAGRSNVGKSSLLNSLMHRKSLVNVSGTPGRTRLLNWFEVNNELYLCDLPGYGFAKVPISEKKKWKQMIETYLDIRSNLLTLVVIVDVRRGFQEDDLGLISAAAQFGLQPIMVATKCDKLSRNELLTQQHRMCDEVGFDPKRDLVWYSSETHRGRDELWRRLVNLLPISDGR
jgi:GTP-binding protein